MNRTLNAAKLDFLAGKSVLKMTAFLLLFAILIGTLAKGSIYTMIFTMVFAVTSSGSIFSIHEKSHSDKLYGILPLKKSEMIIGRYLYALIIGAAYTVIAGILGFVMSRVMSASLDSFTFWGTLMLAFIYFSFATSISYPIYLKFSFTKAYVFTMLPMYVIAVLILVLTKKTNFISNLSQVMRFFTDNQTLIPIFGILIGLILLALSALIANLLYTRKEI
jgi:ABC-type transport system involved in cytochrome c biogenesis permease subunit